jgi:hypothetical protein
MAYSRQIVDEVDASVELYLLNFWVKDHSVRDVCDRIAKSSINFEVFAVLLGWFKSTNLKTQEDWKLSDLRKIASLIAESVLNKRQPCREASSLIQLCVEKEGRERVLQTMEIQLMHSNDILI